MATSTITATATYSLAVDNGADWGAIYKDGELHSVGHPSDLQEQLLDLLGITTEYVRFDSEAASEIRRQGKASGQRDYAAEHSAGWPANWSDLTIR